MLLSIVLPVYNMEVYLEKCLESILRQGLAPEEYEVILVNDGSTDNSPAICQRYVDLHKNFRLINQQNSGVAAARNKGIDAANGKFVGFVDPDDYLLDNGLNIAFRKYAERDDVDVIHFYSSYDFWEIKPIVDELEYYGTTHEFLSEKQCGLPSFCWIYIYRKDFLDRHNNRFKPYRVGEDQIMSYKLHKNGYKVLMAHGTGILHLDAGTNNVHNKTYRKIKYRALSYYMTWYRTCYDLDGNSGREKALCALAFTWRFALGTFTRVLFSNAPIMSLNESR